MADFNKTAINQNAKREYTAPIADEDTFAAVVAAFESDTTMGFETKTRGTSLFKTKIEYFAADNESAGYATVYLSDADNLAEFASFLKGNEATETAAGIGGSSSRDSAEDTWTVKFSCVNMVGGKEDAFTVTIGKDYMSVTGFTYDDSLTKIETWADTQDALK